MSVDAAHVPTNQDIPDDAQMGRWPLASAWYGVASAMFFVYIGAAMAVAYGTVNAIIGIVLTIIAYSLINAVLSRYAIDRRATVAQISRSIFGKVGAGIAMIIFALVAIYYAVFEGLIVAVAFQTQFGGELWIWSLVVVIYSTPLILGGARKFIDKLNGILLPLYFFGLIAAVIWASVQYGASDTWLTHMPEMELPLSSGGPGWLATFVGYMGIWIMMMFTVDYAALGRRSDTKFHQVFSFGPVFYTLAYAFAAFVGIFLTFTIPGMEVTESGVAVGIVQLMGPIGLIVIFASQTRINTANYYLGATNLESFGQKVLGLKIPYIAYVIFSSVVIFLIMLLPILSYILVALAWQGVLVTAWVSIALVHILMSKYQGPLGNAPEASFKTAHAPGLIAWAVATVIGIFFIQAGIPWGATWGPILTAVIAAVLYAILRNTMKQTDAYIGS